MLLCSTPVHLRVQVIIQTHLILNVTNACCITHPAVHLHPQSAGEGGRHGTWPQCVSSCVKIATSNPVILMFDSHRWVLRRLSSSKGYDAQPYLLIHGKQQHWDARVMNLSLPRMPIIVEPTTMLVVYTCGTWVCNYSGLSLGFPPAPL